MATSGVFTIEVDEALEGAVGWEVTLDAPQLYLRLRTDDAARWARGLLEFLRPDAASLEMSLGGGLRSGAKVVRDDETAGRRFFVRLSGANVHASVSLGAEDVGSISRALEDVLSQLES